MTETQEHSHHLFIVDLHFSGNRHYIYNESCFLTTFCWSSKQMLTTAGNASALTWGSWGRSEGEQLSLWPTLLFNNSFLYPAQAVEEEPCGKWPTLPYLKCFSKPKGVGTWQDLELVDTSASLIRAESDNWQKTQLLQLCRDDTDLYFFCSPVPHQAQHGH